MLKAGAFRSRDDFPSMKNLPPTPGAALNAEQNNLRRIDMRLKTLTVDAPGSTELARMQAARDDVLTRLSPYELAASRKL